MNTLAWRRTWFQVHKWIGLILAILIVPLCLSGAALVWDEPLDRIANPARYAVTGDTLLTPSAYVAAAARVLKPGDRIAQLTLPDGQGPVVVAAAPAGVGAARGGPPPRMMVYLDPPTAKVLEVAPRNAGLVRFLHVLHGSLQLPGVGRQVVGWIGVAMLLSCVSGLWLWWPTVGRWVRGLRWRRHRNTDTNLHHLLGFWIALPLFVLSLTGAWISFPQVFGGGGPAAGMRPNAPRPVPLAQPGLALATVIASARAAVPGEVSKVEWPTDQKPMWKVGFAHEARGVAIDDRNGATEATRAAPEPLARTMRRLHDGTRMGLVWQIVIFLGGLLPAILAVTGIIMWWRARGWRAQLKARQRARA